MAHRSPRDLIGNDTDRPTFDRDPPPTLDEDTEPWVPEAWIPWERGPQSVVGWMVALGFLGLCGLVALRTALDRPEWVVGWRITAAYLLFTGVLFAGRYRSVASDHDPRWLFPTQLGLVVVMFVVVYQSSTPGIGFGIDRSIEAIIIFLVLLAVCLVADDPRRYTPVQWFVFATFVVVVALYFYHSLALPPESVRARHPVWGGVLFGLWLVVIPRLLPSRLFVWALTRLAVVVTVFGMAVYVLGPYEVWGIGFRFHDAYTVPILDYDVRAMRSFFVHRNSFAIVVLAGFIGAIVEYHRSIQADLPLSNMLVPSALLVITGTGFALSYGRALWVVGVIPLVMYLAYVDFGRRSLPVTAIGGMVYLFAGILGVYAAWTVGFIDRVPGNRYSTWGPAIAAILANPSWLGEGLISTANYIEPWAGRAVSPHNSYLSTWIRLGAVGGVAYIALVVASLIAGGRRYRTVDVAIFVLAVTFAAHQVFESYTMFRWVIGSAIAALSIGYLVFGAPYRDGNGTVAGRDRPNPSRTG